MAEKKRVLVRIDNQEFTVVSNEEQGYVVELARYVDKNIGNILNSNSKLSKNMAYILAAFNLADEFYKEKESFEHFKSEAIGPMESCEQYSQELEQLREKHDALKQENNEIKDELIRSKREAEKLLKKSSEQDQTIRIKSSEISNSESIIKELQSKLFKEQNEIMRLKKELEKKQ